VVRPDQGRADEHYAPLRDLLLRLGLQGGQIGQGAAVSLFLFRSCSAVVFVQLRIVRKAALMSRKSRARWARNIRPRSRSYLPELALLCCSRSSRSTSCW